MELADEDEPEDVDDNVAGEDERDEDSEADVEDALDTDDDDADDSEEIQTTSSPQRRSNRSTTAHIVLDLRSLIGGFYEGSTICSRHHSTANHIFA